MGLAQYIIMEARSRAGLGLRELARRAETSHSTLHRYETGQVDPAVETLVRIVGACGYELNVLLAPPDQEDAHLQASFAKLTPAERLHSLSNWDALRGKASGE